jgi:hypothetical protein
MPYRSTDDTQPDASRHDGRPVGQGASTLARSSDAVYEPKRKPRRKDLKQRELDLGARPASRSEAGRASPREAGRGDEPLYLSLGKCCAQQNANEVASPKSKTVNVLSACKCASWYCLKCMASKGFRLKRCLREALEGFQRGVFGITLTIDGELYPTPHAAWLDVMGRRLIPRMVEKLHEQGHLASRLYFWVVEFQKVTKQPHWHLLVDARRIPFGVIVEQWSACRPSTAPKLPIRVTAKNYHELDRPAFGSVRFSFKNGCRARSAANYACKYLIKPPEDGFPDWVLDHLGRVPRYGRSRGFFKPEEKAKKEDAKDGEEKPTRKGFQWVHGPECFCPVCRGEYSDSRVRQRKAKSIRERIAGCGERSMLIQATATEREDGKLEFSDRKFERMIDVPYAVLKEQLPSLSDNPNCIVREFGSDPDLHYVESTHYRKSEEESEEDFE